MKSEGVMVPSAVAAVILLVLQFIRVSRPDFLNDAQYAILEQIIYSPFVDGAIVLLLGFVARANVYSRDSVEKLTGRTDPPVPAA